MSHRRAPIQPSTAYLEYAGRGVRARVRAAHERQEQGGPQPLDAYPEQARLWRAAAARVRGLSGELTELLHHLHDHPELAFEETRAQQAITGLLHRHGHHTDSGVHGVSTALRSSFSTPHFDPAAHRTVAVMAEYDALPDIGHACGHNIIAAAGAGAYLAAVDTLRDAADAGVEGVEGRVILLGTPAEEGHSGKEYMIRGGALDGVDMAVMIHPFSYDIASHVWVGRRTLRTTFTGVAAHASSQPYMGRNALDAASLAYQGIGLLRQQMPPSDRLHAVITEGGHRPSVIPDRAVMDIYVRSLVPQALVDLSARIDDILDGAALMAGVRVEKGWDTHPPTLPVRNNETLAARWATTQAHRGRVSLPAGVVPDSVAASTDFGNVSHLVPAIHPMVKIAPEDVALHTREFARWSRSPEAETAARDSATGLAQVIIDILADPELAAAARREFAEAGGEQTVADYFGRG
nr:M20 family metallopeptidase [Corynebacterium halotolerans]